MFILCSKESSSGTYTFSSRSKGTLGSLSKRTFQGDAVVKSAKARDSRRRSRAKFNLLRTGATRLGGLHSQILACLILLSLLWYVLRANSFQESNKIKFLRQGLKTQFHSSFAYS